VLRSEEALGFQTQRLVSLRPKDHRSIAPKFQNQSYRSSSQGLLAWALSAHSPVPGATGNSSQILILWKQSGPFPVTGLVAVLAFSFSQLLNFCREAQLSTGLGCVCIVYLFFIIVVLGVHYDIYKSAYNISQ
jgi:hypothetical protein